MFNLLSIHENVLLVDHTSKFGVELKCSDVDMMPKFAIIFAYMMQERFLQLIFIYSMDIQLTCDGCVFW